MECLAFSQCYTGFASANVKQVLHSLCGNRLLSQINHFFGFIKFAPSFILYQMIA
jgi:hypothetical protein